ncbi:MAG: rhomboid family intramembrane serine protease [Promethearchaeota archaeon]|nr:MAG: rhomboid family intramembrane serine protease [Candidatus Lokiarchaeota archaeon]
MYVLDIENFKQARITQTLIIINIFSFIVFNIILPIEYILQLAQINEKIIIDSEYHRLITSMFLHANIMHIFSNMVALLIFGTAVEKNYYKWQYLIIYFLSGLIGNLFSLLLLPPETISLGASGAIFGLIGAAFILFIIDGEKTLIIVGLIYLLYFIIASFSPGINIWAHLFGLTGGLIFGYIFLQKKKIRDDYFFD